MSVVCELVLNNFTCATLKATLTERIKIIGTMLEPDMKVILTSEYILKLQNERSALSDVLIQLSKGK